MTTRGGSKKGRTFKKQNSVPRGADQPLRKETFWLSISDKEYVVRTFGSFSAGIRALIRAHRTATENAEYDRAHR